MSNLFALFTRDSHRVLVGARRVAKKYRQEAITPNHLLLALLDISGSQAEQTLNQLSIKSDQLNTQVNALVKMEAEEEDAIEVGYQTWRTCLSVETTAILEEAQAEAREYELSFVDTRGLLLGMLRHHDNSASALLENYGVSLESFRARADLKNKRPINVPLFRFPSTSTWPPIEISPVFAGLLLCTVLFCGLIYAEIGHPSAWGVFFLLGGVITTVALHEFAHAVVAYIGGDKSVAHKGYLTLNPLNYAHPMGSVVLPMIFLLMGGLPLPGGAVYINYLLVRGPRMRSLVSAAGPLATLASVILLSLPFVLGWHYGSEHPNFWAILAAFLLVQLAALFLNMLPIPGLDGFGIIEPFLERGLAERLNLLRPMTFFILFFLFFYSDILYYILWIPVDGLLALLDPNLPFLAREGLLLCLPWLG